MSPELIKRYQQGGDIYISLAGLYGSQAADTIAEAARTGDRTRITEALTAVKFGQPLEENTSLILLDQLISDPLGAPLDAFDSGLKQIFASTTGKLVAAAVVVALVVAVMVYLPKPSR